MAQSACSNYPAGGCVLFRPTGTISWTWDSHEHLTDYTCDSVKEGTLDTASVLDPSRRQLYFRAADKDHLEYWGSGAFSPPSMECVPGVDLGGPNGLPDLYFSLAELSSGSGAPDAGGNTCAHTTWQIDTTAATITGSCFGSKYDDSVKQHSVKYEWNLTRTGSAPGS